MKISDLLVLAALIFTNIGLLAAEHGADVQSQIDQEEKHLHSLTQRHAEATRPMRRESVERACKLPVMK